MYSISSYEYVVEEENLNIQILKDTFSYLFTYEWAKQISL